MAMCAPRFPITITVERCDPRARVSVHNSGTPIPAADHARMFDAYARARSAEAGNREGWGLGLTRTRRRGGSRWPRLFRERCRVGHDVHDRLANRRACRSRERRARNCDGRLRPRRRAPGRTAALMLPFGFASSKPIRPHRAAVTDSPLAARGVCHSSRQGASCRIVCACGRSSSSWIELADADAGCLGSVAREAVVKEAGAVAADEPPATRDMLADRASQIGEAWGRGVCARPVCACASSRRRLAGNDERSAQARRDTASDRARPRAAAGTGAYRQPRRASGMAEVCEPDLEL